MPGTARLGDPESGHDDFPGRTAQEGSPNVFVNGKPVVRLGDSFGVHANQTTSHSGTASSGSPNVFVNGKPKCRIGDSVSCGGSITGGSSNVIVN